MNRLEQRLYPDFSTNLKEWEKRPARYFLREKSVPVGQDWDKTQLLSLTKHGVVDRDIDSGVGKYPASFEGYQLVEPGNLIFCLFDVEETPRTVGLVHNKGMITSAYTAYEVNNNVADSRFLEYLFVNIDNFKRYRPFYSGLRNTIPKGALRGTKVSLPPLEEQKAIADFLDRESGQMDSLLAKQSELANLLDERFQANLKKLVIDFNNLDRKEATGLWEPTLPRTWSTVKLGLVANVFAGGTPSRDKKEYWEDGTIPWINSGAVNQRFVETPSEFISQQGFDNSSARWIEPGSLVMALARQGNTTGMVARVGIRPPTHQSIAAITITASKVQADFAYWYLLAHYKDIRSLGGSDLRDGLNLDLVSSIKLPVPPNNYQAEVSSRLFTEWNRKELLIDRSVKMIDYLNQRKQALINAAVTGKLDIWAKN